VVGDHNYGEGSSRENLQWYLWLVLVMRMEKRGI